MVFDNQLTVSGNGSSSAVFDFQTQRANQDPVVSGFFFPWNDCRVRQIVQITCSGGIATVTTSPVASGQTSHGVSEGGWVEIAGSSIAAYNGKKAVTSPTTLSGRSSNTFTFASSCGGTASNSGMTLASPWDGNTNASGYPCMDQIGRGKGALISGFDALGRFNLGVLSSTKANQQSEPLYIWNNTRNGALSAGEAVYTDPSVVAANRDYFNQDNTNCAPRRRKLYGRGRAWHTRSAAGELLAWCRLLGHGSRRMEFNERRNTRRSPVQVRFGEQLGAGLHALRLSSSARVRCSRSSPRCVRVRISSPTATESSNPYGKLGVSGPLPRHCGAPPFDLVRHDARSKDVCRR